MSRQLLVVSVVFLAAPSAAFEHEIGIEARLKGDRTRIRDFFLP